MAFHLPFFNSNNSKAVTTPQAQNQLAAEMEMIHDIIPSMYTAYTDTGVQPSLNFYQLANKYTGWVYTAIEKKARTIAGLPKMVYRFEKKPQGGASGKSLKSYHPLIKSYDTLPRHQRRQFLKDNGMTRVEVDNSDLTALLCSPNSDEIEFNFWHGAIIRLELTGSIGIYKVPGLFSKYPVSMYNIPTTWTGDLKPLPGRDGKQMIRGYMYTDGNIRQEFTNEEIIWIKYNSLRNPYEGMSAIKSQLSSFNIDTYLLNQQSEFMKNHAVMGNTLTTEQSLTDDAFKSLRQQIRKIFQGGINSGKANVLHSGLKFDAPVRSTTRDMMIEEVEHMVRDRILSAHDISAGKVGLVDVQNRSNLDTVNENYINETISPTSKLMCQYLTRDLAQLFDPAFVIDFTLPKFENDQIQKENMEDLGAYVKTINEIRAAKDLEPVKWGDMPWIPFNLQQYTGETKPEVTPAVVPTEKPAMVEGEETPTDKPMPVKSIKSMSTEQKTKLWKKFDTTAKAYEPLYTKVFAGIFSAMKKEVIDNIEKKAVPVKCSISVVSKSNRQKWLKDNNGKIKGLCFDKKEMAKTIQNRIKPVMEKINKDIADEMVGTLTAGTKAAKFKYNVNDKKVQKYIGTRLRELSTSVTDTMADKVESSLSKDFEDGASILTMSENIADVFTTEEKYRSDLIARTETTSACSHAELDAVEQMGLEDVLVKIWVAEPDARDTHAEAADKYSDGIPISEDFEVGDDNMSCPGNGSLAEENCNCRCMLVYDTEDPEKSFKGKKEDDDEVSAIKNVTERFVWIAGDTIDDNSKDKGFKGGPGSGRYPEGSGDGSASNGIKGTRDYDTLSGIASKDDSKVSGAALKAHAGSCASAMDSDDLEATASYQKGWLNTENGNLRQDKELNFYAQSKVDALDTAFSKVPTTTTEMTTYRIAEAKWGTNYTVGSVVTDKGFVSTTCKPNMLKDFAIHSDALHNGEKNFEALSIKFTIPKGSKVMPMAGKLGDKGYHNLNEVTLNRGSKFKVISANNQFVHLELIND